MKYKLLVLLVLCAALLTGCGCEHEWKEATCEAPKTCAACGAAEGEALGHNWQDAICEAPKTCTACGVTEGEALGHNWQDATCEAPKTCTACGVTEGEALGHNWQDATCEAPKTCTACSAAEGEALGHIFGTRTQIVGEVTAEYICSACGHTEQRYSDCMRDLLEILTGDWYTVAFLYEGNVYSVEELLASGETLETLHMLSDGSGEFISADLVYPIAFAGDLGVEYNASGTYDFYFRNSNGDVFAQVVLFEEVSYQDPYRIYQGPYELWLALDSANAFIFSKSNPSQ